jgi:hypothetical protein
MMDVPCNDKKIIHNSPYNLEHVMQRDGDTVAEITHIPHVYSKSQLYLKWVGRRSHLKLGWASESESESSSLSGSGPPLLYCWCRSSPSNMASSKSRRRMRSLSCSTPKLSIYCLASATMASLISAEALLRPALSWRGLRHLLG